MSAVGHGVLRRMEFFQVEGKKTELAFQVEAKKLQKIISPEPRGQFLSYQAHLKALNVLFSSVLKAQLLKFILKS